MDFPVGIEGGDVEHTGHVQVGFDEGSSRKPKRDLLEQMTSAEVKEMRMGF